MFTCTLDYFAAHTQTILKAQIQHEAAARGQIQYPQQGSSAYPQQQQGGSSALYPSLNEYMGLQLTPEFVQQNMPVVAQGLFVALVQQNSPAALAGLRFGDQILQINGQDCAGWDTDKAHKVLKQADANNIRFALRDRPFERTITMNKDSQGFIGFVFRDGRIKSLVKDSSAARNGILTDHQLIEVNGQNVVGVKDDQITEIIDAGGRTITVTIMPSFLYDHIVKCMGNSIIKKLMDHSIPDV
ncbi:hypothetical protein KUTeg_017059 [Tegillarca granosa]|uniref:PDZ domain-containing protein n=1 Tax=Tegillarca granosa TaxID=220873 RepID=A0ABQ9EML5_TEGGR|nr:hypothetical protein KUTeg_017059 [Tegillarca granosa]